MSDQHGIRGFAHDNSFDVIFRKVTNRDTTKAIRKVTPQAVNETSNE